MPRTKQTTRGTDLGNDSIIAFRTRELLRKHLGIFSPQFKWNRWKMGFLGQMLFGIQASRDTLMSEIARSLQESILAKKTQERLEWHLAMDGMDAKIHGSILCDAAPGIGESTLVIVNPTDVQKKYADKMPYLAKVWDGSKGRVGDNLGYTLCMAIAYENGCRQIVPLMLRLWSSVHPEYVSENDEVEQVIGQIASSTNGPALIIAYAHCIEQGLATKTGPAHQKAAVESVHFPLWRYNPEAAGKKITIDSQDKSDTVSFAKNAVSKELGENRFKQLVKKVGPEKAMAMLEKSEQGFKENYALLKKLSEM